MAGNVIGLREPVERDALGEAAAGMIPNSADTTGENVPRECGGCGVCCTAMNVPELNKPAGRSCVHQTAAGCGNYERRPEVCRVWHCMWIRDDGRVFTDAQRPDRLGLFFTATEANAISGAQVIVGHQVRPGAVDEPEARQVLTYLRQFAPVRVLPYRKPDGRVTLTVGGGEG